MTGYKELASFMADYPEAAIFRKFSAMGNQTLVNLQSELLYLEEEAAVYWEANELDPRRRGLNKSWKQLQAAPKEWDAERQRETAEKIHQKLRAYCKKQKDQTMPSTSQKI
jgi:hypothetical protein